MLALRDSLYYKALPFFLGVLERFEAGEYARQKSRISKISKSGNNHLFLTHGRGGGVDKYVEDAASLREAKSEEAWILHFHPIKRRFFLSHGKIRTDNAITFKFPGEFARMVSHLQTLGIKEFHIHHIRYLPFFMVQDLPDFASSLGAPYDYTMHDFIAFCPRIHLIDKDSRYCGMPQEASKCNSCVAQNGFLTTAPGNVTLWRETCITLLKKASAILAPSHDTAERHKKILGNLDIKVIPHDVPDMHVRRLPAKKPDEPYTIAVIGRIHRSKGAGIVLSCARDAMRRKLPLRFAIIGDSTYTNKLRKAGVTISGIFKENELPELLRRSGASLVFLPSIWPETFSYVLSHIWQNSYFPVAFDLGAPAERIRAANNGLVLPMDMINSPGSINDALLGAAQKQHEPYA